MAVAHLLRNQLGKYSTKIGHHLKIAPFLELLVGEAGSLSVNVATANSSAQHEHEVGMPVVGAPVAVFFSSAAEFRHRDNRDISHAIAHILRERRQSIAKIAQQISKLSGMRLRTRFIDVRIPSAYIRERDLQANVRFDQSRNLLQALP